MSISIFLKKEKMTDSFLLRNLANTVNIYVSYIYKPTFFSNLLQCLQGIFIFVVVGFKPTTYGAYVFPWWADGLGWCISLTAILAIPAVAICKVCTSYTHLSLIQVCERFYYYNFFDHRHSKTSLL